MDQTGKLASSTKRWFSGSMLIFQGVIKVYGTGDIIDPVSCGSVQVFMAKTLKRSMKPLVG